MQFRTLRMFHGKRKIEVNFVWRRSKKAMDRAFSAMIGEKPDDDPVTAYGWMNKYRGKDVYFIGLSGVGRSLLDTIIHEACHCGQKYSKNREVSAEFTAILSSALIYDLRLNKATRL